MEEPFEHRRYILIVFILLLLSNLIPLWSVKFPPLQDYPNHLARAKIIADYSSESIYQRNFSISYYPLPNLISDFILVPLVRFVSPLLAGKLLLSFYLLLLPLAVACFVATVEPRNLSYAMIAVLWAYNWFFNMGYLNYYASISIFFLCLSLGLRYYGKPSIRKWIILLMSWVVLYFSHLFSYTLMMLTLPLFVVFKIFEDRRRVIKIFLTALPSLALFIFYMSSGGGSQRIYFRTLYKKLLALGGMYINFSPLKDIFLLMCTVVLIMGFSSDWFHRSPLRKSKWLWVFISLFIVYLILPYGFHGGGDVDVRMLPFLMFIGLVLVKPPEEKMIKYFLPAVVTIQFLQVGTTFVNYRSIDKELEPSYEAMMKNPPYKVILPINCIAEKGRINPYQHFWAYYVIEKAGITPYLFAYRGQQPLRYRKAYYAPDEFYYKFKGAIDWKEFLPQYDYVLVFGHEKRLEQFLKETTTFLYRDEVASVFRIGN